MNMNNKLGSIIEKKLELNFEVKKKTFKMIKYGIII